LLPLPAQPAIPAFELAGKQASPDHVVDQLSANVGDLEAALAVYIEEAADTLMANAKAVNARYRSIIERAAEIEGRADAAADWRDQTDERLQQLQDGAARLTASAARCAARIVGASPISAEERRVLHRLRILSSESAALLTRCHAVAEPSALNLTRPASSADFDGPIGSTAPTPVSAKSCFDVAAVLGGKLGHVESAPEELQAPSGVQETSEAIDLARVAVHDLTLAARRLRVSVAHSHGADADAAAARPGTVPATPVAPAPSAPGSDLSSAGGPRPSPHRVAASPFVAAASMSSAADFASILASLPSSSSRRSHAMQTPSDSRRTPLISSSAVQASLKAMKPYFDAR
jgi:hypothetical protein